jgi:hypothetical protein
LVVGGLVAGGLVAGGLVTGGLVAGVFEGEDIGVGAGAFAPVAGDGDVAGGDMDGVELAATGAVGFVDGTFVVAVVGGVVDVDGVVLTEA